MNMRLLEAVDMATAQSLKPLLVAVFFLSALVGGLAVGGFLWMVTEYLDPSHFLMIEIGR